MQILENRDEWDAYFKENWLAHVEKTGQVDWSKYQHPRNASSPIGAGIQLREANLMFITSAGAYLRGSQAAFDDKDLLGDYSVREIPIDVAPQEIDYAHGHYDEKFIRSDIQSGIPLQYLKDLVADGTLGSLSSTFMSFMGYQPDSIRVIDLVIPPMLAAAKRDQVNAALFAPL